MPTLETRQSFERYRITQWLGSGGSGECYEAEDTMLHRTVALKLVHPTVILPDPARRQFFRAMQGISILNHIYLAPVLDYGEFDGKLYVARRYFSNGSLLNNIGRLWFQAPLDVSNAVHYGHQLAQTLQHIHNRGYVHGALTFANILVLRAPDLVQERDYAPFQLADVGLTHFVHRLDEKNCTPLSITAAPEQLHNRMISASDQFALAVLLFYWLSGRPPFIGSPEEIAQLKLTETITPLSSINPSITVEQDRVILRALSASPEDRYHSVQAFAEALLATLPPETQPVFQTESAIDIQSTILDDIESTSQSLAEQATVPIQKSQPSPEPDLFLVEHPANAQGYQPEIHIEVPAILAHLIIFSPYSEEPYTVELQRDEMTIGRAGSSDILLDRDDLTSRHHALLKRENDRFMIYDRRSANGIQVNGEQIQSDTGFPLVDGDHIKIGNYELTFRVVIHTTIDQENRSLTSSF
jgi:serine/threonine protein kinase